jgi:CheY-like chemotaxis protein
VTPRRIRTERIVRAPLLKSSCPADCGGEAIELMRTTELDVLAMDLSMPGQSGIDALAMIRAKAPDVGILRRSSGGRARVRRLWGEEYVEIARMTLDYALARLELAAELMPWLRLVCKARARALGREA